MKDYEDFYVNLIEISDKDYEEYVKEYAQGVVDQARKQAELLKQSRESHQEIMEATKEEEIRPSPEEAYSELKEAERKGEVKSDEAQKSGEKAYSELKEAERREIKTVKTDSGQKPGEKEYSKLKEVEKPSIALWQILILVCCPSRMTMKACLKCCFQRK